LQGSPAQQVKVNVKDRLAGLLATIGDHTKTLVRDPLFPREPVDHQVNIADEVPVLFVQVQQGRFMPLRNHEEVDRGLGIDILKGKDPLVFVNPGGGDAPLNDLAKKAIIHKIFLLRKNGNR